MAEEEDEDAFMLEGDGEDGAEEYDFQYESDGDEDVAADVNVENRYYNAKALREEGDTSKAMEEFRGVVDAQEEQGDWGFKALKQMVKLHFRGDDREGTMRTYKELLTYTKSAVTRNYSEKSINNILDHVSSSTDMHFMEEFYATTLTSLEEAKNERLWLKTNLKLAKLWLDRMEVGRLNKILRQLHQACQTGGGEDDQTKGTYLLEVYALEIQLYTATKNNKKLKDLYWKTMHVKSAIPHPRIMGVIRECGGKMHMGEGEWDAAQVDFFESFKNYDEAGSLQRIQVLKYLVLANMLVDSAINPFDSQETKPYKNDVQIIAMTDLVGAYQRGDIHGFERILKTRGSSIMDDPFIREHIDGVVRNIRTSSLVLKIRPYSHIGLGPLAAHLNVDVGQVEELLVGLILDGRIHGRIDGMRGTLEVDRVSGVDVQRFQALDAWSRAVDGLWRVIVT